MEAVPVCGDPVGFDEFVAGRGAALLRFAYLLSGDRGLAEDLVQEALVKAFRRWSGHGVADRPEAYVRQVLVHEYVSWRRRRSSTELPGPVPDHAAADARLAAVPDRDVVWRLLADLPRRQRAVLALRYYADLPDREIAALLGCAEGTVRSLAARAFGTLRRHPQLAALDAAPTRGEGTR